MTDHTGEEKTEADKIAEINQLVCQRKLVNIPKIRALTSSLQNHGILNQEIQVFKPLIFPFLKPHTLKVGQSIALVGNSRSLLNNKFGKLIDQHDDVVRFNWAITKGYEEIVGGRETIRVSNLACLLGTVNKNHPKGLIPNYKIYQTFSDLNFIVFSSKKYYTASDFKECCQKSKINYTRNRFYGLHWQLKFFNHVLTQLSCPYKLTHPPQVGLGITLLACCLGIKVSLFGFDTEMCDYNFGYYWAKIKHKKLSPHHNIKVEHRILKWLHENNIITIN